jgi:hypothetical protein
VPPWAFLWHRSPSGLSASWVTLGTHIQWPVVPGREGDHDAVRELAVPVRAPGILAGVQEKRATQQALSEP